MAEGAAAPPTAAAVCRCRADAPLVVVVERDPDLRHVLRDLLAEVGYRVLDRATPPGADELARIRPGAVVLDLAGDRDGDDPDALAFLRAVAESPPPSAIPVIACLGGRDLTAVRRAEVARLACAVVAKPFAIGIFLAAVARCTRT